MYSIRASYICKTMVECGRACLLLCPRIQANELTQFDSPGTKETKIGEEPPFVSLSSVDTAVVSVAKLRRAELHEAPIFSRKEHRERKGEAPVLRNGFAMEGGSACRAVARRRLILASRFDFVGKTSKPSTNHWRTRGKCMIIPDGDRDYWKLDHESNEIGENLSPTAYAGGTGAAPLRAGCQADCPHSRHSGLYLA
jgi:hypothetical protein